MHFAPHSTRVIVVTVYNINRIDDRYPKFTLYCYLPRAMSSQFFAEYEFGVNNVFLGKNMSEKRVYMHGSK